MAAPHATLAEAPYLPERMDKPALRAQALAARRIVPGASEAIVPRILALVPGHLAVAGTWPLGTELDLRPALHALHARGQAVLLPETTPRGEPLRFRRWTPSATMLPGLYGTRHPDGPLATPGLLLVPLLAFDARCHRLGYGGGYYDRTIAALRAPAIGCAYAAQQVDEIPILPHDAPLDAVATENGVITRPEA